MARQTAVVKKTAEFKAFLIRNADKIKDVMAKGADLNRIMKVSVQAFYKTPKLQECTPDSLLLAVCNSAQLGLDPCGLLGSAYIVPYGTTAQLIVGYRGLIDLARRSGQILSIEAHVVHENERFLCIYGLDAKLEHEPCWDGEPGAVKAAYAIARLVGGAVQWEVMTKKQIDGIRARSKAGRSGPWVTDYEEMAKKTAVRRLCKYLPLTTEFAENLETMDSLDMGETVIDAGKAEVVANEPTTTERVRDKLKGKQEEATDPEPEPDEANAVRPSMSREELIARLTPLVDALDGKLELLLFAACGVDSEWADNASDAKLAMMLNRLVDAPSAAEEPA